MSEDISCYVQTVQNMDSFLSKIYVDLKLTGKEFSMIYFSDHGLIISDYYMIHGEHVKEVYDVPLLIWDSGIDSTRHIKALRNGKSFIRLFCEMNNIHTTDIDNKYRFISEDIYDSSISQLVMGPDTVINYNNLRSNSYSSLKVNPYHKY